MEEPLHTEHYSNYDKDANKGLSASNTRQIRPPDWTDPKFTMEQTKKSIILMNASARVGTSAFWQCQDPLSQKPQAALHHPTSNHIYTPDRNSLTAVGTTGFWLQKNLQKGEENISEGATRPQGGRGERTEGNRDEKRGKQKVEEKGQDKGPATSQRSRWPEEKPKMEAHRRSSKGYKNLELWPRFPPLPTPTKA